MYGKIEHYNGIPVFIPNDTFNLSEDGCYVSYNPSSNYYGNATTALVRMNGIEPTKFLILNGNHTKEYFKLGSYEKCLEYFKNNLDQQNKYSENWDEDLIFNPDGSFYVQKVK